MSEALPVEYRGWVEAVADGHLTVALEGCGRCRDGSACGMPAPMHRRSNLIEVAADEGFLPGDEVVLQLSLRRQRRCVLLGHVLPVSGLLVGAALGASHGTLAFGLGGLAGLAVAVLLSHALTLRLPAPAVSHLHSPEPSRQESP